VREAQVDVEALVARFRELPAGSSEEVHDLYTDGCAEMLRLEAELLRLKRRLVAAEADSLEDVTAARTAATLRAIRDDLVGRLDRSREIVRLLRTALDWNEAAAAPAPAARASAG
jgi:hypothetical protein